MWEVTGENTSTIAKYLLSQSGANICVCMDPDGCDCYHTLRIERFEMDVEKTVITTQNHSITLYAHEAETKRIQS